MYNTKLSSTLSTLILLGLNRSRNSFRPKGRDSICLPAAGGGGRDADGQGEEHAEGLLLHHVRAGGRRAGPDPHRQDQDQGHRGGREEGDAEAGRRDARRHAGRPARRSW